MSGPVEQTAGVLIVDDRQDKLISLEVTLTGLGQPIELANSGKEALRCLLTRSYACILLDVNMPGMDGFETASLIRQRKESEHTPIIFITSTFDHDTHINRGYSLGAVDYIMSPVLPEVLRAKVQVFIELFKKNQQLKRQAASLKLRAEQLQLLNQCSLKIHSAQSIESILKIMTEYARTMVGAQYALVSTTVSQTWSSASKHVSLSEETLVPPIREAELFCAYSLVGSGSSAIRMNSEQWQRHMESATISPPGPPYSNILAVPLLARDSENMGMLCVAGRAADFTAEEESVLIQLAQIGAIAIENTLNYEAREANKIKDEFLATLSHELRTPLTSILAWTRMLRSGKLEEERRARGLEIIERNVRAQTKLIDDLLDVSRIIVGKIRLHVKAVDLCGLLNAVIDSIKPASDEKNITISSNLDSSVGKILGDHERLQQVFSNLILNSIKFTPQGGRIEVRLDCVKSRVQVTVADNGSGIPPEFLPYIFEPFRQADSSSTRSKAGLGLGLAIVRHLVELHGGTVEASSDGMGKGSAFNVTLPVVALKVSEADPSENNRPRMAVNSVIDLSAYKILIVDDEPDSRETICEVLRGSNAVVQTAESALQALELVNSFKPSVLVSDVGMPERDGLWLIQQVRSNLKLSSEELPGIALTAFAREEDRQRALEAGFNLHIAKPVEPADLIAGVALYCSPVPEQAARGA